MTRQQQNNGKSKTDQRPPTDSQRPSNEEEPQRKIKDNSKKCQGKHKIHINTHKGNIDEEQVINQGNMKFNDQETSSNKSRMEHFPYFLYFLYIVLYFYMFSHIFIYF